MNKAIILALILAALFQSFVQRKTGIYYQYDDGVFDPYEPVYTAKDNSDIALKILSSDALYKSKDFYENSALIYMNSNTSEKTFDIARKPTFIFSSPCITFFKNTNYFHV